MPSATVLVVDYEANLRQLVVGLLEGAGYQVFQADSAVSALEIVEDRAVDLVVCNVLMPEISGIELSLRAQERQPGLRVLLTTGHLRPELVPPRLADTARVLEEPFRPEVLLSEVKKILRQD